MIVAFVHSEQEYMKSHSIPLDGSYHKETVLCMYKQQRLASVIESTV